MTKQQLKSLIKECIKEALYPNNSAQIVDDLLANDAKRKLDTFTKSYIATALWSSTDNLEPNGGDPLDEKYDLDDFESQTLLTMVKDCKDFQQKYGELYEQGGWSDDDAGYDFWLTRNRQGSGFWDRSYKQPEKEIIGKKLTKAAHSYGEFSIYLGDGAYDGLVCGG